LRRPPAAVGHGLGLRGGDEQQFVLVRHDHVAHEQVAELARLDRAGAHLGHRGAGEAVGENFRMSALALPADAISAARRAM
jgi:hypothetical protein